MKEQEVVMHQQIQGLHPFDEEGNQGVHQRHSGHVMICQETEEL